MESPPSRQPYQLGPVEKPATQRVDQPGGAGVVDPAQPPRAAAAVQPIRPVAAVATSTAQLKAEPPKVQTFMPPPRRSPTVRHTTIALAVVLGAAAVVAMGYPWWTREPVAAAPAAAPVLTEGSATIISRPDGAQVIIDGTPRGVTPLKVMLPIGSHTLELQNGTSKRSLPLVVEAGSSVRQYVDLAPGGTMTGHIEVTSEPAGAQVTVDGVARGVTPLLIEAIEPGEHRVVIAQGGTVVNRTVQVTAGATAMVVASMTPSGAAGGWIAITSPIELQVFENGRLIGTSTTERLMLPAGNHQLEFVSSAFDFKTTATVNVPAGRTAAVPVALPKGSLSINALPWADVWLDGQPLGTTPLGNLSVTVGQHEIIWRHPQHGERRQTVKVTAQTPVRAGVDLTK
jgi:hypothetical protein